MSITSKEDYFHSEVLMIEPNLNKKLCLLDKSRNVSNIRQRSEIESIKVKYEQNKDFIQKHRKPNKVDNNRNTKERRIENIKHKRTLRFLLFLFS